MEKNVILKYRRLLKTRRFRLGVNSSLKDTFFIIAGIFSAAFGLESFLLPNRFIDGGATGISLLVSEVSNVSLALLIILVNIPFLILGFRVIGRQFTIKAVLAILGLALVLTLVEFPEVTEDRLLVAVFGGFFLGAGIGLSIRGGGVLDGTEVLAIFLSRKLGVTIGDVIILINIIIFLAAAYLLSIETALYSMLTYLAASKTLDFVVEGIEEYTGVTIISPKSEEIRHMVTEKMGRGLTIYKASGGYGREGERNEYDVIYTVITRLEIRKLNMELTKIDPQAFVVMNSINDTRGGMVKKRKPL
ncbi:YitT family protein [Allomuricauda sp. SCSIO 65647]|uniref:YitT family protein n=1 Tax=Allomuricauda sp. SCSIO 65647 TaxID=2908843 RepID=UPI001F2D7788|nr:YitT family protein [Muricauda sp. SCSIO 65647]UJH66172.1 YitT family protein [Muricauda sp. SCSIO 65647]